jgi:hypothetical protein
VAAAETATVRETATTAVTVTVAEAETVADAPVADAPVADATAAGRGEPAGGWSRDGRWWAGSSRDVGVRNRCPTLPDAGLGHWSTVRRPPGRG